MMEARRDHRLSLGGTPPDETVMNRILLSYRPIAPKPASGDPATFGSLFVNKNPLLSSSKLRSKRRYARANSCRRRTKGISSQYEGKNIVTLQLLPEKDESNGCGIDLNRAVSSKGREDEVILPEENREPLRRLMREADLRLAMQQRRIVKVESWVTVERVTGAWMLIGQGGAGVTVMDEERVRSLERDTCPGMLSDGENRVVWVNEAYKRKVMGGEQAGNGWVVPEMTVWLLTKPGVSVQRNWSAFSSSVRVRAWHEGKCSEWGATPCDAWRMAGDGFAWRLDVEAALRLGCPLDP